MKSKRKIARVIELHGQRVQLSIGDRIIDGVVSGKLKHEDKGASPIAVGDYVEYSLKSGSTALVEKISERRSVISKPSVEKGERLQIIVSNVDRLAIVTSVTNPEFRPGLVDRFLVIAFKEEIKPVVILNKIDLKDPLHLKEYFNAWRNISCDIIYTSAKTGKGVCELADIIRTGTTVIAGHSGVGKTALLNSISPNLKLKTKKVSFYSDRGVHTTSRISLYRIFDDGWVADTPGLKVFGLAGVSRNSLRLYFPEFRLHESGCRFTNCRHIDEPSCGVKDGVGSADDSIAKFRYESYRRIYFGLKDVYI